MIRSRNRQQCVHHEIQHKWTKAVYRNKQHSLEHWPGKVALTFLWFHNMLTLGFPLRQSAWSTTSSWMRDAEWIISEIMATCLCDANSPLYSTRTAVLPKWRPRTHWGIHQVPVLIVDKWLGRYRAANRRRGVQEKMVYFILYFSQHLLHFVG